MTQISLIYFHGTSLEGVMLSEDYEMIKDIIKTPHDIVTYPGYKIKECAPYAGVRFELWNINTKIFLCFRFSDFYYSILNSEMSEEVFEQFTKIPCDHDKIKLTLES